MKRARKYINLQLHKPQRGLSLIEILITVVVLSIGMLGIAATQTLGMTYNNDSYLRSQATMLVNELTERMSLNLTGVDGNNFVNHAKNGNTINADYDLTSCGVAPATICEGTTNCTPDQLAIYDLFRLACGYGAGGNDGITNIFPNATLNLTCIDSDGGADADDCTDGSNHQITISWQRSNLAQNQVQMVVRP